jgi:hypothetical protein
LVDKSGCVRTLQGLARGSQAARCRSTSRPGPAACMPPLAGRGFIMQNGKSRERGVRKERERRGKTLVPSSALRVPSWRREWPTKQ